MNKNCNNQIKTIKPIEINLPYDPPFISAWVPEVKNTSRSYTLVKLITEDDIVGWGVCAGELSPSIHKIAHILEGKGLFETEQHIRVLRSVTNSWGIEIALWDAIGKVLCLPLYKLWGGYKGKIKAYASTAQAADPIQRVNDALAFSELGFKAIKLRAHYESMRDDIHIVENVRKAVGSKMDIMVDANQAMDRITLRPDPKWDFRRAKNTAKEYEKLDVVWLEEPLPKQDMDGLRKLCEEVDMPIAGGESVSGLYELSYLVKWNIYDILQPDPLNSEGISQLHKIARYCELMSKWFIPHHGSGGIGFAANLHLCCAIPNSPYIEYMYDPPYRTIENYLGMGGIIVNPPMIDNEGYINVPQSPGLGLIIDESIIEKYKVSP